MVIDRMVGVRRVPPVTTRTRSRCAVARVAASGDEPGRGEEARSRAVREREESGMESNRPRIDMPVFAIAAGISVAFVLVGVLFQDELATVVGDILSWILTNLGWLFVLSTAGFLIFVAFLACSRYGRIRWARTRIGPTSGRSRGSR